MGYCLYLTLTNHSTKEVKNYDTHFYVNNNRGNCIHIDYTYCLQSSPIMNNYSEKDYPNLYQEILKDYHWTWGKFNPNNYPTIDETIKTNWRHDDDN